MKDGTIGKTISQLLAKRGIRKRLAASKLDIPEAGLYKRLNGTIEWRLSEIRVIAHLLEMTVDGLIDADTYNG